MVVKLGISLVYIRICSVFFVIVPNPPNMQRNISARNVEMPLCPDWLDVVGPYNFFCNTTFTPASDESLMSFYILSLV